MVSKGISRTCSIFIGALYVKRILNMGLRESLWLRHAKDANVTNETARKRGSVAPTMPGAVAAHGTSFYLRACQNAMKILPHAVVPPSLV